VTRYRGTGEVAKEKNLRLKLTLEAAGPQERDSDTGRNRLHYRRDLQQSATSRGRMLLSIMLDHLLFQ